MSDFISGYWHWYISIISLVGILGCGLLLWMQHTARPPKGQKVELHGHVWDDDLTEYNNPLPRWWMWLFYITIVFALVYLVVYPGLGTFGGKFNWTSANAYEAEMKQANADYGPLFDKYAKVDVATLSKDPQANAMGQRLFLTYCAQCHGSDAGGAKGFPNLRDKDWLYGGDAATIETTIIGGRNGIMPALGAAVGGEEGIKELVNYVRSLSGLKHDAKLAEAGKPKFAICAACHGPEAKGMNATGAPNLTDAIWLYGSSEETIAEGIRNGRNNMMPAQKERLGEAKIHLLAAYVYSLGGGMPAPAPVETTAPADAPAATAPPK
ncbi:MAG: cytochrome-c oxidase, cbb3-type subunit III [Betaproteobacteria bacterium]|nr:cytochrome-c oxidase, cbb3-type subunit III [Betaproteobacteria bacterium]